MTALLLGLGYLALAAAGATCWGLALAGSRRAGGGGGPSSRWTGVLVAAALAALATRAVVVWLLARQDPGFGQEKAVVGLPLSAAASAVAASLWWMPRPDRRPTAGRDGNTAGAFAAAVAAALAEIVLSLFVGAPVGPAAAVAAVAVVAGTGVVTALVRTAPGGRSRRPAFAAGAASAALIVGVAVVGFVNSSGAGALQAAGFGLGAAHAHGGAPADGGADGRSVTDLTSTPHAQTPSGRTVEVVLSAQQQKVDLPSGRSVDAWTFGAIAGPAIVARVGDSLRVRVTNVDLDAGATVHWHGYPVANAFDGVAGVTQDALRPGEEFRAEIAMTQPGTYWYHTHQRGSEGVVRGLYGTLVVEPAGGPTDDVDLTLPVHTFSGAVVVGTSDVLETRVIEPGASIRLRLVNTDQLPQTFVVQGASFRVVALDGTEVASGDLRDRSLVVPAGGRVDVVLRMPGTPVRIGVASDRDAGIGLVPRAGDDIPALTIPQIAFDPLADLVALPVAGVVRSSAAQAIEDALGGEGFDVERTVLLDRLPRLVQGLPAYAYTVDGRVYPYIEPTVVDEGDTVRLRFVNRGFETHPMHPHGHTVRVLSVDGRAPLQPLWLDSFDVGPGEVWEVALFADNPGIWMDHCHNLEHAALGMVTHLAYRGVSSPFEHGGAARNQPE